jgi:integrase
VSGVRVPPPASASERRIRAVEPISDEWLAGVEAGRFGRPRGRGKPYSDTTVADYRCAYRNFLCPEFGAMVADEIGEMSGKLTLHECRHTYDSLLMAAGYTLKELMEFRGHADLQMVNRYVKLLPQPGDEDAAERLND